MDFLFCLKNHRFLDGVPSYAHTTMQDAGHIHGGIAGPIDDEMLTGGKYQVRRREFWATAAYLRVLLNRQ